MWAAIPRPKQPMVCCWPNNDQNMHINPRVLNAPALIEAKPHRLETLALNFVRLCFSFGIDDDANFEIRALAVAATSGTLLSKWLPDIVTDFVAEVRTIVPLECDDFELNKIIVDDLAHDSTWVTRLREDLLEAIKGLSNNSASLGTNHKLLWAMAWGACAGRMDSAYAERTVDRYEKLSTENRFICSRLPAWALEDYEARNAPIIEFFEQHYRKTPIEREVICSAAYETLRAASLLRDPWDLMFWAQTGWSRGRLYAKTDTCRMLFEEAGPAALQGCRTLFQDCVLETTRSGEIQLEKAVHQFFATSHSGVFAQVYCRGEERRVLVQAAFDFSFWMGILSALPLPRDTEG